MKALGEGKITPEEMPVDPKTNKTDIMLFGAEQHPYTIASLARFLGETKDNGKQVRESFRIAFNAIELIDEGWLNEFWWVSLP